jgi:hypothetical protein
MSDPISSMLLWLPPNGLECADEFIYYADRVTAANDAVLDFCDRELSFVDMLERLSFYKADVDDYLIDLDANLRQRGA